MATDAPSTNQRPGGDPAPSTWRRRRRPRWWVLLLTAAAAVAVATVGVIQLQPNPADGPPVAGGTQVALHDNRFHPPVIQITQGQTVTWSFDDNATTVNVKGKGWGAGDRRLGHSGTPSPHQAATATPARCTWA